MPRVGSAPQEQNRPACADRGAAPFRRLSVVIVALKQRWELSASAQAEGVQNARRKRDVVRQLPCKVAIGAASGHLRASSVPQEAVNHTVS